MTRVLLLAAVVALSVQPAAETRRVMTPQPTPRSVAAAVGLDAGRTLRAYGELPLAFVPNAGQTDRRVRYSAHAGRATFHFTSGEAVFALTTGTKRLALRLAFLDANPHPRIEGAHPTSGRVNYLIGRDPSRWRVGLATYEEVVYRDLWPRIDLVFRSGNGDLKYEFRVAPGGDPRNIRLEYRGATRLSVDPDGSLRIDTAAGVLRDSVPVTYQVVAGERMPVESRYTLERTGFAFALGAYDSSRPLVIDPGLVYSTFLGGGGTGTDARTGNDSGIGIAVDASGSAYVVGATNSPTFPRTAGAFDTAWAANSSASADVFVTKLNPLGTGLEYSTYLGGIGDDAGIEIAADAAGHAYVTGHTASADFPTTSGAFDTVHNGSHDVFVVKLNQLGTGLEYSTFVGGTGSDGGNGLALDAEGRAYLTGFTQSSDFPTTAGAFDRTFGVNNQDVFVARLNAAGSALDYSTYLGGGFFGGCCTHDVAHAVAVDAAGNAYVTGSTSASNFPTTPGAFDTTWTPFDHSEGFVAKLNAAGSALLYSTFLGGNSEDGGYGITVDGNGNAYVIGITGSTSYPTTPGAFDTTPGVGLQVVVTKLNAAGTGLEYSTYLGRSATRAGAIAIDAVGSAYVTGSAGLGFPTTPKALDTTSNNGAFVTKLDPTGAALRYSTYLGGSFGASANAIAADAFGNAYVTGSTSSSNFPTTPGAFDRTYNGPNPGFGGDAFVAKLEFPATVSLMPAAGVNGLGTRHTVTAMFEEPDTQPIPGVTIYFTVTGSVTTSGQCTTAANGQCPFSYDGPATAGPDAIRAFADVDGDGIEDADEPVGTARQTWVAEDDDGDGVADHVDNCPSVANSDQADVDGDGVGDGCDNCREVANADQADTDHDGVGNACEDADSDGVDDISDNCPDVPNPDQRNTDADAGGDACDPDDDGDGVVDGEDAFPLDPNESIDTDGDGIGNSADADDDQDGVADGGDAFPLDPNESSDTDGDGLGNNADPDDDNDGVLDGFDAFPSDPREAADNDRDGIGNNTDPDDDNDGVPDARDANPFNADADGDGVADGGSDPDGDGPVSAGPDNCPSVANGHQIDTDGDGQGDACDADDDDDGVADDRDNCAAVPNPDQTDTDRDGTGDICDLTPGSTPGKVAGGGFITAAKHNFSFSARYRDGMDAPEGHVNYEDRGASILLRSTRLTSLRVVGTYAILTGSGTINGASVDFEIHIADFGEPGRDDTFSIRWQSYDAGGVLQGGNIQIVQNSLTPPFR